MVELNDCQIVTKKCVIAPGFCAWENCKREIESCLEGYKEFYLVENRKKKKRCFIELRSACHTSSVLGDGFTNRCETDHLVHIMASRDRCYFPIIQMSKLRLSEAHLT